MKLLRISALALLFSIGFFISSVCMTLVCGVFLRDGITADAIINGLLFTLINIGLWVIIDLFYTLYKDIPRHNILVFLIYKELK